MKKKLFKIMITAIICCVMIAFSGCNEDGNGGNGGSSFLSNHFTYEGTNYSIEIAIIDYYYDEYSELYYADISLGKVDSQEENGYGVFFSIALSENILHSGTYNFENSGINYIDYGDIGFLENGNDYYYEIVSGSVTIKKSNDTYEFSFNFTDENGEEISGKYKGKVEEYGGGGNISNYFDYNGVTYPIEAAMYANQGYYEEANGYIFTIAFYKTNASETDVNALTFTMLFSDNFIPTGTFYFKDYITLNMIGEGEIIIVKNGEENHYGLNFGSVSIQKSNNVYNVTFNCYDVDGNSVTGTYNGLIEEYNKKSNKKFMSFFKKNNKTTQNNYLEKLMGI